MPLYKEKPSPQGARARELEARRQLRQAVEELQMANDNADVMREALQVRPLWPCNFGDWE